MLRRQQLEEASICFFFSYSSVNNITACYSTRTLQPKPLTCVICTNTRFLLFFSSSRVQFSFERMPLLGWIRCLICSALLFISNPSEPANGTQALDQHRGPVSNDETGSFLCSCSDKKGRTYNLASLAKRDGTPRFVKNQFISKLEMILLREIVFKIESGHQD